MSTGRHGGRFFALILAAIAGCGPSPASRGVPSPRVSDSARNPAILRLEPPSDRPAAVARIAWEPRRSPGLVGVLWTDGRFAAFRASDGRRFGQGRSGSERPARSLAVLGPRRVVSGDGSGLTLWDVSGPIAREIGRRDLGAVSALGSDLEIDGDPSLAVALADGRLLAFRFRGEAWPDRPSVEGGSLGDPPIVRLAALPEHRGWLASREDGTIVRFRPDGSGGATAIRSGRAASAWEDLLATILDGPGIAIAPLDGSKPGRKWLLPRPCDSIALAKGGSSVAIGGEGAPMVVSTGGAIHEVSGFDGLTIVSTDPGGSVLAIGDGSGRVEIGPWTAFEARSRPLSPDDLAELAFRPSRRFDRPRDETTIAPNLSARLDAIRRKLDRGETSGLLASLREMEEDDAASRDTLAEIAALVAAVERSGDGPGPRAVRSILAARDAFARAGRADREADMLFWAGLELARPFELPEIGAGPRSSEDAIGPLARAARLYRSGSKPLERQALLADAARAWVLLDLGHLGQAIEAFRPVAHGRRVDPVLRQVVEIDRISASLAAARGDWAASAEADARVLDRLAGDDRPGLRREAARSRSGALAALKRFQDAAETLPADVPAFSGRRGILLARAGGAVRPPPKRKPEEPGDGLLRGLLLATTPALRSDALAELATSAELARRSGQDDLAAEADLLRAELLERMGKPSEAAPLYSATARSLLAMADDPIRRASRPVAAMALRATRGRVRAEIALGHPSAALAASLAADTGQAVPIGGNLGLASADGPTADRLREARRKWLAEGGPGGSIAADAALVEVRRLEAALAVRRRRLAPIDASAPFDPDSLGLAADEAILSIEFAGPQSPVAFLIRPSVEPEVIRLSVSRDEIDRGVASWRNARRGRRSASRRPEEIAGGRADRPGA